MSQEDRASGATAHSGAQQSDTPQDVAREFAKTKPKVAPSGAPPPPPPLPLTPVVRYPEQPDSSAHDEIAQTEQTKPMAHSGAREPLAPSVGPPSNAANAPASTCNPMQPGATRFNRDARLAKTNPPAHSGARGSNCA